LWPLFILEDFPKIALVDPLDVRCKGFDLFVFPLFSNPPSNRFFTKIPMIMFARFVLIFMITLLANVPVCRSQAIKASAFDGIVVAGFVDRGGFTNFTGPNINWTKGDSRVILSALPSLRYKKDEGPTQNAFVTPTLGIGLTYSYKLWAVQLPFYYNSKTATENGRWHIGIGLGLRLNYLNKTKSE
jgi:hypothetical protein